VYVKAGEVRLWFDVSGPSVVASEYQVLERRTIVAVHGGPGLDHTMLKAGLRALEPDYQLVYFDQRGHGRSDHGDSGHWNLPTWASDLQNFCDAIGVDRPIVLGSSFGGFVALTYAGLFPDHPSAVILANTTGGRLDHDRSVEIFRRLGGDEAAAVAARDFSEVSDESAAEFNRVCFPLMSAAPGFAKESQRRLAMSIQTMDVNLHYFGIESKRFDPWSLLSAITCPVLILAGTDDPVCPIEVVDDMAAGLTSSTPYVVRLPGARHAIFRDDPASCAAAIRDFVNALPDHRSRPEDSAS
jgi:pimeloyl-ACP methyl ester carboxylesterase